MKMLMSPVSATLDAAKRILGLPVDSLSGGIDAIRDRTFAIFMQIYNKSYPLHEIPRRRALFFQRKNLIDESVRAFKSGKLPFAMQENAFIDWEDEELKKLTGVSMPKREEMTLEELEAAEARSVGVASPGSSTLMRDDDVSDIGGDGYEQENNEEEPNKVDDGDGDWGNITVKVQIPAAKDWRDSGCVAKPMDQEKCGACYAIATMNTVESMRCLKSNSSPTLSSQQIIDCATPSAGYSNYGCDGGWPTRVLKYLQSTKIAARESCYKFVRRQNTCRLRSVQARAGCTVSASPTDSNQIEYKVLNNERDILYHVATTGPVITVMKATNKFLYYGKGIFDDSSCSRRRDDVDHAIAIVGYGRENGQDYWIIKNSWGTTGWGQNGYGLYKRGSNVCSIGHWGWAITK